jgi:3-sulfinopropanoyl-CoA desulfinase
VRTGRGFPDALDAAKAKTFAAEMAQEVTSQALQIHGAAGYGRSLPLERMARDARMFAIGGGTVEMMRNLIADRLLPTPANRQARRAGHLTGLTPRAGPD